MTNEAFSGSCLCGQVAYRVTGSVKAFYHCHCGRCRKASGTGHASNVIVACESFEWQRGESERQRYVVPEAKRFHTVFCTNCGGPLPRLSDDRRTAVIPAGTLDSGPELSPTGRIFQDSRTPWSCHGDGLPAWETYPG